jgi:serine/threonine-protein kinase
MTQGANPHDVPVEKKPDSSGGETVTELPFGGSDSPTEPPEGGGSFVGRANAMGMHLPDFELLGVLGRGGMGIVYKARQKSLGRLVAVKMLLHEYCQNEVALARFNAEARTAASLKHPNIVGIHQVGESPLGPFFVMEYVEGQTLEDTLEKRDPGNPVPVAGAVALMIAVTEAVAYGHRFGVIHRDLKPANIMIDEFKRPIVMDFGIAKVTCGGPNLTHESVVLGTPAYMPPEQTGQGVGTVGPHSDVYSLGAILYRLLTGRVVFEADTPLLTIVMVVSPDLPTPVSQLRPDVPPELNRICMKCLNKNPADRFADAGALAGELRSLRAQSQQSMTRSHVALRPVAFLSAQTGKSFPLKSGVNVLGRAADCDVVLKSRDVSKRHCQILVRDDQVTIEDLGSINGTLVNGEAIRRGILKDGDVLGVGDHHLTFHLNQKTR